jgi:hypothetical protein
MFDDEDDAALTDAGDDDQATGGDQGEGFLQALEDAWSSIWTTVLPTQLALTDPVTAFTLGDGSDPADSYVDQTFANSMEGKALTALKGDALSAVGIDPNTPLWVYLVALVVILLLVAYITREVAG